MLIERLADIRTAKERLASPTLITAAELISNHIGSNPNNWPEDSEETAFLLVNAVIAAKQQRIGHQLTEEQSELLLGRYRHEDLHAVLTVGLSGGLWQLRTAGKINTGMKWAGKAALVGLGAALGFGIG